jgi:bla regulator protein BlaR1
MNLTVLGWFVVHSAWQVTFIAGLTALALGLLPDRRARTRYASACTSLAIMVIAPILTAASGADFVSRATRFHIMRTMDATVGLPTLVYWRSVIVPAAALVWIVGFGLCVLRLGADWRRARGLRHHDLDDADDALRTQVDELSARLSPHLSVDIRSSARARVPMVLGSRRPVILLPRGTASALSPSELRAVLAHELAHVGRRDYLVNLLQRVAETMLFHHPGARWVSRRIRTEREYCCDDAAVAIGQDPGGYARALAALDEARDDCRLVVAAASGTLLDRIQRIVGRPRPMLTPARGVCVLLLTSLVASVLLALAMAVPPSLPLSAKLRSRVSVPGAVASPPLESATRPRTRQR